MGQLLNFGCRHGSGQCKDISGREGGEEERGETGDWTGRKKFGPGRKCYIEKLGHQLFTIFSRLNRAFQEI